MGWRTWSNWIRHGSIGILIGIVWIILTFLISMKCNFLISVDGMSSPSGFCSSIGFVLFGLPMIIIVVMGSGIISLLPDSLESFGIICWIIFVSVIVAGILGIIIGHLIRKIKNNKRAKK